MTSQKAQIQALIHQIDDVLTRAAPRMPWVMSSYVDQQRQVLEETRGYLAALEQQLDQSEQFGGSLVGGGPMPSTPPSIYGGGGPSVSSESAQQVLQAVLQEMNYLRSNVMHPLRTDIESLQQRRDALAQEIRLLEAQRQQYQPPPALNQQQLVTEFLQSLMGRLQENLTGQVAQMLVNLEAQTLSDRTLPGAEHPPVLPGLPSYQPTALTPSQRLEHLQMVQAQSDQLLLQLDSTLRVIFDSLQSNVQSYQESLSQGLDKMHSLGQQGEAMFAALVNRLAQQLGREASSYLQSSLETSTWEPSLPLSGPSPLQNSAFTPLPLVDGPPGSIPPSTTPEDLPELDLSQLNLDIDTELSRNPFQDNDLTFLQTDFPVPSPEADDEEMTLFQMDEEITRIQSDLEEFSQRQRSESPPAQPSESERSPIAESALPDLPQDAGSPELDELYESLFGSTDTEDEAELEEAPVDQHLAATEAAEVPPSLEREPGFELDPESDAFSDELLNGLIDVAQRQGEAEDGLDPANLEAGLDALDDFLFQEPEEEVEIVAPPPPSASAIPVEELAWLPESEPDMDEEIEPLDTVSSLTELIGLPDEPEELSLVDALQRTSQSLEDEDTDEYIPASPDEDLLAGEIEDADEATDLHLPMNALQQLTADLSNLEGASDRSSDPSQSGPDSDWAIAGWFVSPDDSAEPPVADSPPSPPIADPLDELGDFPGLEPESVSEEDDASFDILQVLEQSSQPPAPDNLAPFPSLGDDPDAPDRSLAPEMAEITEEATESSSTEVALPEDLLEGLLADVPEAEEILADDSADDDLVDDLTEPVSDSDLSLELLDDSLLDDLFTVDEPDGLFDDATEPVPLEDSPAPDAEATLSWADPGDEPSWAREEDPPEPSPEPSFSEPGTSLLDDLFAVSEPNLLFEAEDAAADSPDLDSATEPLTLEDFAPPTFSTEQADQLLDALFNTDTEPAATAETPLEEPTLDSFAAIMSDSPDSDPTLDELNAFTLEGLDSLFEDLPDAPSSPPSVNANGEEVDSFTLESAFGEVPTSPETSAEGAFQPSTDVDPQKKTF